MKVFATEFSLHEHFFFSRNFLLENYKFPHFRISPEGLIKLSSNVTVVGSKDIPSTFIRLDFCNPIQLFISCAATGKLAQKMLDS